MVTVMCHGHDWLRHCRRVGRLGLGLVDIGRRRLFLLLRLARRLAFVVPSY